MTQDMRDLHSVATRTLGRFDAHRQSGLGQRACFEQGVAFLFSLQTD
jgi:hypothetical protein